MSEPDEALLRLLAYHRRRYWLTNGWCIRFRIKQAPVTEGRPYGISYSFTLHDVDMSRLLGFDNAHGVPRRRVYDHRHRFRRTDELVPYSYVDADTLLVDFFEAVETACKAVGVEFAFETDDVELDEEVEGFDGEDVSE